MADFKTGINGIIKHNGGNCFTFHVDIPYNIPLENLRAVSVLQARVLASRINQGLSKKQAFLYKKDTQKIRSMIKFPYVHRIIEFGIQFNKVCLYNEGESLMKAVRQGSPSVLYTGTKE